MNAEQNYRTAVTTGGLTKHEHIAVSAMQGILASRNHGRISPKLMESICDQSADLADEMLHTFQIGVEAAQEEFMSGAPVEPDAEQDGLDRKAYSAYSYGQDWTGPNAWDAATWKAALFWERNRVKNNPTNDIK